MTMDGVTHDVGKWDLLIAHPPCTYLSNAGASRLYKIIDGKSYVALERLSKGMEAKDFFLRFLQSGISKIAVENPVPSGVYRFRGTHKSSSRGSSGIPSTKRLAYG